jgi:hypothetical protein
LSDIIEILAVVAIVEVKHTVELWLCSIIRLVELEGEVRIAVETGNCAIIVLITGIAIGYSYIAVNTLLSHIVEILVEIAAWWNQHAIELWPSAVV